MINQQLILTDLVTDDVVYIPILPQEFQVTYGTNFLSYHILRVGEVQFPDGVELSTISWDSFFDVERFTDHGYIDEQYWKEPVYYHDFLERVKVNGHAVRIMLTESPINFDCYLQSFTPSFKEYMGRIYYSVSWVQCKAGAVDVDLDPDQLEELDRKKAISYRAHVRDQGWQDWRQGGEIAGSGGQALRMEALEVRSNLEGVEVEYRAYCKDIGWQPWVRQGQTAGTVGELRPIEAVEMRLSGPNAPKYDIHYRLHVADYGWLQWSKNGETNGTIRQYRRAEAIQIVLGKMGSYHESDNPYQFMDGGSLVQDTIERPDYRSEKEGFQYYGCHDGDTLWDIAGIYYGQPELWEHIYAANKTTIGDDPNHLFAGMRLIIPNLWNILHPNEHQDPKEREAITEIKYPDNIWDYWGIEKPEDPEEDKKEEEKKEGES